MRRVSLAPILTFSLAASSFALTALTSRVAHADDRPVVAVPTVATAPVWSPQQGCHEAAWSQGTVIPINAIVSAVALRTATDLYVCLQPIGPNDNGITTPSINEVASLSIDTKHSMGTSMDGGDLSIIVEPTGPTTVSKTATVGPIFGGSSLPASEYDAWGAEVQDAEFQFSWHVAFRVSKQALGGAWGTVGAGLVEEGQPNDPSTGQWPNAMSPADPLTWGDLNLGDGTTPDPTLESFFPYSGNAPQFGKPGDSVTLYGRYLDSIDYVYFQNDDEASSPQSVAKMRAPILSRTSTAITVQIPELGVTGSIRTMTPDGRRFVAPGSFTVNTYSSRWGYDFENWNVTGLDDITFGDLTDVFGRNELYYFGVIPSIEAVTLWGIGVEILKNHGHCYGMSYSAMRMRQGDQPLTPFLAAVTPATATHDLLGTTPNAPPDKLAHHIAGWHFVQFSSESLRLYAQNSLNARLNPNYARGILESEIRSGMPVLVATGQGSKGHVLAAYDVVDVTSGPNAGGYDIKTYDPDLSFRTGLVDFKGGIDTDEQPSGWFHADRSERATIHVNADGSWSSHSTHEPAWTGGPGDLVVMPYEQLPQHPTLPWTLEGIFSLALGEATVTTTQLSDDQGHTLFAADGSENQSATRLPNTVRYAPLTDGNESGANADGFIALTKLTLHQTMHGTANGTYRHAFTGRGVTGLLDGVPATAGVDDDLRFETNTGTLDFRTKAASKAFAGQLVGRTASGAERGIAISGATSSAGGSEVMKLDAARSAPSFKHAGRATDAVVTLKQNDASGAKSFLTPKVHLADGDLATFTPHDWTKLDTTTVDLAVKSKSGKVKHTTLHNQSCDTDGGAHPLESLDTEARASAADVMSLDESSDENGHGVSESGEVGGCATSGSRSAGGSGWLGLLIAAAAFVRRRAARKDTVAG